MIVWSLFDSGNGSYARAASEFPEIENFSIGIDRENKNTHFINLNLADYSCLFGKDEMIERLEQLPPPDLIIASPPCESWSVASAMDRGNACWKQERGDALFEPQVPLSKFTVRDYDDYERYQFKPEKSLMTRINGELTIFNTIRIIRHFKPKYYIIENPAHGRIWEYIERVLGFDIEHDNITQYNKWNYPMRKATRFGSNLDLRMKDGEGEENDTLNMKYLNFSYNQRSNIPDKLVQHIFNIVLAEVRSESHDHLFKRIRIHKTVQPLHE